MDRETATTQIYALAERLESETLFDKGVLWLWLTHVLSHQSPLKELKKCIAELQKLLAISRKRNADGRINPL